MEKISINDYYKLANIKKIIYIEDDIEFDCSTSAFIYDLLFLPSDEQTAILGEIELISKETADLTRQFIERMNAEKVDWETIPKGNMEYCLKKYGWADLQNIFNQIENEEVEKCADILRKYGIGIREGTLFTPSIAIAYDNQNMRIPLRIIGDFSAESSVILKREFDKCISSEQNYVCIIDDQLGDKTNCSREIIDFICDKIAEAGEYGTYLLLTSKDKKLYERFDEKIHIEYVGKNKREIDKSIEAICNAYIKSNYSMLINKMKKKRIKAVEDSYKYAIENRDIAMYLADMAQQEGITNFEIIESWLELRERYYWNNEQTGIKEEIKQIIKLSSLLGNDEGAILDGLELEDSQKIRSFEEYDYNVNMYYKPIGVGDIFVFKGNSEKKYFVLVGQECDMILRKKGKHYKRKSCQCILLPIEILPESYVPKFEQSNGYEKVVLGNFQLEDGKGTSIKIDCTKEYIVDDVILDMCSYQQDGKARVNWEQELEFEKKYLVTYAMANRYQDIKNMLRLYNEIKGKEEFGRIAEELYLEEDKYISVYSGITENGETCFDVQRICRLKRYTSLITKMYIEHKWRSGFETINLDNVEIVKVKVLFNETELGYTKAGIQLTSSRKKNHERIQLKWYIKCEELKSLFEKNSISNEFFNSLSNNREYYIFDCKGNYITDCIRYKKQCDGEFNHKLYFYDK